MQTQARSEAAVAAQNGSKGVHVRVRFAVTESTIKQSIDCNKDFFLQVEPV